MNIRAPNVNAAVRAPLSADQLRAMSAGMFGAQAAPEIPGSEAVTQGIKQYNPYAVDVPQLPDTGLKGVVEATPITPTSDYTDLAMATQSPYAARPRYEPVLDEQGQPMLDENGQYQSKPIEMGRFGEQQQAELEQVPNFGAAIGDGTDSVGIAKSILGLKTAASENAPASPATNRSEMMSGRASPETIRKWADTSAPSLSLVTEDTTTDLFSPEAVVGSTDEGYEGVPIGMKVFHDHDIPFELSRPISTVFGIAHALANAQTGTMRGDEAPPVIVDKNGKTLEDALPEKDIVNSIIHGANNALDRLGYNLPPEAVRRLAEAKVKAEIYRGNYRPVMSKDGHWVLATSPDMKKQARDLAYLTAALSGDERRKFPSKVPQLSGSSFLKPGSQTTKNSLRFPGAKASAAEVAKDILGSIAETFEMISVMSTTKQMKDIEAKLDDPSNPKYSTSIFAKRHKMSQEDYNKLKDNVNPEEGMSMNDPRFKAKQERHATEEMQARLAKLKYDIQNANDIKGLAYTGYMHSTANQRFFRTNAGTDILASKNGTREMLNFGLKSLAKASDVFDPKQVKRIQEMSKSVFTKVGRARQEALLKMTSNDRAMLGLMETAVVNFYTFSGDPSIQDKRIAKYSEVDLINMYTPEIGMHLAALGKEFIQWLSGDTQSKNIEGLLAGMPRGEAQSCQNLWFDMANLYEAYNDPAQKNKLIKLTTMNYDDGNQNGVFLQSLYAGKPEVSVRLGSYNPNLADMRGFALNKIGDKLEDFLKSKEEKLDAWKEFLIKASKNDSMASDLFKVPLMQYAYGKDGSMFTEHIYEFIKDSDTYAPIAYDTLIKSGAYADLTTAADDMSKAMEATLNEVVDPQFTSTLKRLGRMFAVMGTVPTIKGVAGDDYVFSPVDVGFIPDSAKDEIQQEVDEEGNTYITKKRGFQSNTYTTPDGVVESTTAVRQFNPNATKGLQKFFNKSKDSYDSFENPLGSALSRLLGVMPIQSTDGDLLKLMLIAVNSDQRIPLPVATVHDSLITTMDTMHLYRNAYNNIAIPQAVPEIKKFASRLKDAYDKARSDLFAQVSENKYIGIGANGDYPSLGALFDELNNKINNDQYKEVFLRRNNNKLEKWEDYVAKSQETLREARKQGWRPDTPNLAIDSAQFKQLFSLSESLLKIGGAENRFKQWVNNFASNVEQGFKKLNLNPDVRKHGIAQMTQAGGSGKRMVSKEPVVEPRKPIDLASMIPELNK